MDNITKDELHEIIKTMKAKELRTFVRQICEKHPAVYEEFKVFNHMVSLSTTQYIYELESLVTRYEDELESKTAKKEMLKDIEHLLMAQLEIHYQEKDYEWMMDALIATLSLIGRSEFGNMEQHLMKIHEYLLYITETVLRYFEATQRLKLMRRFLTIAKTCNEITETYILCHVKALMDTIQSPDQLYDEMKSILTNIPEGVSDRRIIAIIVVMIQLQDYIDEKDNDLDKILAKYDDYEVVQEHLGIVKLVE
ncbi:hypothetical protein [Macrococcus capreoli]|uniref:hypothetical protein n=1 Tax=Macrococcus capreoli TaxID=2982690 RepID=UPI0021D58F49|nr:hypothetical protein [Macrococcus sp. TMW 2.2395]MCU7558436.1 hypothetical protein [Macrococcus sp. TMW 2.2395]